MWNLTREEQLVLLLLISAFSIGLGIKLLGGIPTEVPLSSSPFIKVKIYGAVENPGLYEISKGCSLQELVKKAGGFLPWADLSEINLSSPLSEPTTIYIPEGKIDLNCASSKDLTYLPGIGPEIAKRIVAYREKKGGFKEISELKEVPGIGEVRFRQIKDKLEIKNKGGNHEQK